MNPWSEHRTSFKIKLILVEKSSWDMLSQKKTKKHNENTLESLNKEDVWSFGIKHGD